MIPEAWINEAEMIKREVLSAMACEADGGDPYPDRRPAVAKKAKPPTTID
jgi:hypothetical protein